MTIHTYIFHFVTHFKRVWKICLHWIAVWHKLSLYLEEFIVMATITSWRWPLLNFFTYWISLVIYNILTLYITTTVGFIHFNIFIGQKMVDKFQNGGSLNNFWFRNKKIIAKKVNFHTTALKFENINNLVSCQYFSQNLNWV